MELTDYDPKYATGNIICVIYIFFDVAVNTSFFLSRHWLGISPPQQNVKTKLFTEIVYYHKIIDYAQPYL